MTLTFECRCGTTFSTDQWIGWGHQADATCKCGRECQAELPE